MYGECMDLIAINSTLISRIGYDPNEETLIIQFQNGTYYQYSNMSEQMYNNMMESKSIGKYFTAYVKNSFPYKKIYVNEEM